jgi:signal recognition particle subunit SEC65
MKDKLQDEVKEWMEEVGFEYIEHQTAQKQAMFVDKDRKCLWPKHATHLWLQFQKQILEAKIAVYDDWLYEEGVWDATTGGILVDEHGNKTCFERDELRKQIKQINDQIRSME